MISTVLVNFFTKNGGLMARLIAAALVAGITAMVARWGFQLSAEDTAKLSGTIAVIVQGLIGEFVAAYQARGIKVIQAAVQTMAPEVRTDGTAGKVTREAVQEVANLAAQAKPQA